MTLIQPICEQQQARVITEVQRYIALAAVHYDRSFENIEVVFNLRGRAAGIYRTYYDKNNDKNNNAKHDKRPLFAPWIAPKRLRRQIRLNPWLFAKYPEDSWCNTIPHEVAHYVSDCLYGLNRIKPHGKEWRQIMQDFGAEPTVRADYDLTGIPVRRTRRYAYACDCRQVELSSYRHAKIQRGLQVYHCRDCLQPLMLQSAD